jgi:hypothetical protein
MITNSQCVVKNGITYHSRAYVYSRNSQSCYAKLSTGEYVEILDFSQLGTYMKVIKFQVLRNLFDDQHLAGDDECNNILTILKCYGAFCFVCKENSAVRISTALLKERCFLIAMPKNNKNFEFCICSIVDELEHN